MTDGDSLLEHRNVVLMYVSLSVSDCDTISDAESVRVPPAGVTLLDFVPVRSLDCWRDGEMSCVLLMTGTVAESRGSVMEREGVACETVTASVNVAEWLALALVRDGESGCVAVHDSSSVVVAEADGRVADSLRTSVRLVVAVSVAVAVSASVSVRKVADAETVWFAVYEKVPLTSRVARVRE